MDGGRNSDIDPLTYQYQSSTASGFLRSKKKDMSAFERVEYMDSQKSAMMEETIRKEKKYAIQLLSKATRP